MSSLNTRLYARCRLAQIESKYIFQLSIQDIMLISLISSINKIEEIHGLGSKKVDLNLFDLDNDATIFNFDDIVFKIFKTEFELLKKLSVQNEGKFVFEQIYAAYEKMA